MKRYFLLSIIFFSAIYIADAQHLMVTVRLDTLNCKIGTLKNDMYPIEFMMDDTLYNGEIHKDSVLVIRKNVFRGLRDNRLRPWYSLIELGFDAGVTYQTGALRIDPGMYEKSESAIKTGYYFGADAVFYHSKLMGYGLKYNYRSLDFGKFTDPTGLFSGKHTSLWYQYIGPLITFRFWDSNRKNNFFVTVSAGIGWMRQYDARLSYINPEDDSRNQRPFEMSASALAGDLSVGYKIGLTKQILAHVKLTYDLAYPSNLRYTSVSLAGIPGGSQALIESDGYLENMNTISLTAGLSFIAH